MRMKLSGAAWLAAAASVSLLPASGDAAATASQPRVHTIVMANMRFGPVPGNVRVGDVVVWVNRDVVPHTATARNGAFDVNLAARQSSRMAVTRSGTFVFYCRFHPGMTGTLPIAR